MLKIARDEYNSADGSGCSIEEAKETNSPLIAANKVLVSVFIFLMFGLSSNIPN